MPKQEEGISLLVIFFSMAYPYPSFTYIFARGSTPEILNFLKDLEKKRKKSTF